MLAPSSPESDFGSSPKAGHMRGYAFRVRRNAHGETGYGTGGESFVPEELQKMMMSADSMQGTR